MLVRNFALRVDRMPLEQSFTIRAELESSNAVGTLKLWTSSCRIIQNLLIFDPSYRKNRGINIMVGSDGSYKVSFNLVF